MRRPLIALLLFAVASPLMATEITVRAVVDGMNAVRAKAGLPQLREDARLDKAAGNRIQDMEDLGFWAHESPDGRSPFLWLRPAGYDYRYAGENLAAGFETSELLIESWMESPGHRANILSPLYADCGVAIIEGSTERRTTGRSVVVIFAREAAGIQSAQK